MSKAQLRRLALECMAAVVADVGDVECPFWRNEAMEAKKYPVCGAAGVTTWVSDPELKSSYEGRSMCCGVRVPAVSLVVVPYIVTDAGRVIPSTR